MNISLPVPCQTAYPVKAVDLPCLDQRPGAIGRYCRIQIDDQVVGGTIQKRMSISVDVIACAHDLIRSIEAVRYTVRSSQGPHVGHRRAIMEKAMCVARSGI